MRLGNGKKSDPLRVMESIRLWFRVLVAATAVIFLISVGTAVYAAVQASVQHEAVCALQRDIEQRITTAREFLRDNPQGLPGIGVSATVLRDSTRNQERTLTALSIVKC